MRQKLVAILRPLHAVAVENGGACPGTPDIWYRDGGIECKATEQWPARVNTPVVLDHPVTKQQKIWITLRRRSGGLCFIMLNIARTWLLFEGLRGVELLGKATQQELRDGALEVWERTPTYEQLEKWLTTSH